MRVVCVLPGFIATPGAAEFLQKTADSQGIDVDNCRQAWPNQLGQLARAGEPDDVAKLITFLASPKAKFLTGAQFGVDGGILAGV